MGQEPHAEGGRAGRCPVTLRENRAGSEESPAHTPRPSPRSTRGLGQKCPRTWILLTLPLWPLDVLEPMRLQQPFASHV